MVVGEGACPARQVDEGGMRRGEEFRLGHELGRAMGRSRIRRHFVAIKKEARGSILT